MHMSPERVPLISDNGRHCLKCRCRFRSENYKNINKNFRYAEDLYYIMECKEQELEPNTFNNCGINVYGVYIFSTLD